jgi:integrase/recombinase XerD
MRRLEIVRLKLFDLQLDRGLILVNQGKGSKDRYVPIGARAAAWLEKYIREGRPQLVSEPDDFTVFLTAQGEPFSRDHLTFAVRERIEAAKLGKGGACHLFRHTMATLMHENGADIRHIQAILGHEDIRTTQIYTQVAIRALQQIHAATHPAEARNTIQAARTAAEREGLLAALQAETEEDEEPSG